jgi:iron-sulfur cluster repair protein YtfE (RIC family)
MSTTPSSSENPIPKTCDARDLIFAHNAFRRLYAVMPGGVRRTPAGDQKRVNEVARNVALINTALHHHHRIEDEFFWDTIDQRRPSCALHVELMKQHHARVGDLLDGAEPLVQEWRAAPAEQTAEQLAVQLELIGSVLGDHLQQEETLIVPVIEEVFSEAEWEAIGKETLKTYDRSQIFLFYGLIQDSLTPQQAAELASEVPVMIKLLYRLIGRRRYEHVMGVLDPVG